MQLQYKPKSCALFQLREDQLKTNKLGAYFWFKVACLQNVHIYFVISFVKCVPLGFCVD